MTDKATEVSRLLAPTVGSLGLELLGIEYLPAPGGATLRLYIDVPHAEWAVRTVTIDDCERVSREVSAQLDVEDPISGNYTLEVSSPGVDRPLFSAEQFARHAGEQAKVVLRLPQDGRRRFQGEIRGVAGGQIAFAVEGLAEPVAVAFDNIEKARLVPDWSALGLAPQKPGAGKGKSGRKPAGGKSPDGKKPTNEPAASEPHAE
mgnify:CR=1 FL=1